MSDNEEVICHPTIEDEFKRANYATNAKGLTEEQIEQRERDTYEMMKMYPKLNPLWADLIWNFVHKTPHERVREIIDNKEWEKPAQKEYGKGGTYVGGTVEDKIETIKE